MNAALPGGTPDAVEPWAALVEWSDWVPLTVSDVRQAPTSPGVYVARSRGSRKVVYAGMAGERSGHGLRGRLGVYARGRAPHSGLGAACMDRALEDTTWVRARADAVDAGARWTVNDWALAAVDRAELEVCWAAQNSTGAAEHLERAVLDSLAGTGLWNRRQ
ncbi:hypothetical protein [Kineosporia sp. A_224]|uniref:hypothetical protein n=1 Tax=Kineosporia sp. A_224 TaxID=1962180 RepID=UPI001179EB83|nr:hypothetical protein [Kineosporia sp. A_224]